MWKHGKISDVGKDIRKTRYNMYQGKQGDAPPIHEGNKDITSYGRGIPLRVPLFHTTHIRHFLAGTLAVLLLAAMFMVQLHSTTNSIISTDSTNEFVQRSGSQLVLHGQRFRFAGANVYWLGLDENVGGVNYPTHFRVDDALTSAEAMGATVIRSHTLGISVGCQQCVEPALNVFNKQAFEHIDYAIQSAHAHHLRLLLPLVDNWSYYHGGRGTFTHWNGLTSPASFYSNEAVISNFEQYISQILNHVNSYTHRAYKDDATILGWETGNELHAPTNWVQRIASYIKKVDTHHLVMDGNEMNSKATSDMQGDLTLANVDMYTGHYYPLSVSELKWNAYQADKANKVFVVGEYDWTNKHGGDALASFLHEIEHNSAISGDLFWSLFGRDDMGHYVQHNDGYTLHYPGDNPTMRAQVIMLSQHARKMLEQKNRDTSPVGTDLSRPRGGAWGHTLEKQIVADALPYHPTLGRDTSVPTGNISFLNKYCFTRR